MSPTAFLIGRENVTNCSHQILTTIVERLQASRSPNDRNNELYSIVISRKHELTITKVQNTHVLQTVNQYSNKNLLPTDEGFESDIDNASLLSSDGGSDNSVNLFSDKVHTNTNNNNHSDSANSSSASDSSDTEIQSVNNNNNNNNNNSQTQTIETPKIEHFQLDSIVCYTNIRFPKVIGFVHKTNEQNQFLLFEFLTIENYDRVRYAFNSLNNAVINKNIIQQSSLQNNHKFNLVQRTDKNGVTHIEISRDNNHLYNSNQNNNTQQSQTNSNQQPSSIISINTPENTHSDRHLLFDFKLSNLSKIRSNSHGDLLNQDINTNEQQRIRANSTTNSVEKSRSNSNLLDDNQYKSLKTLRYTSGGNNAQRQEIDGVIIRTDIDSKEIKTLNVNLHHKSNDESSSPVLKKIWHSAEDILDSPNCDPPKKPERRRKQKGRAPPPPNVMKGQYVRVSVDPNKKTEPTPQTTSTQSNLKLATFETNKLDNYNSNWVYVASQPSSLVLTTVVTPEIITQPVQTTSYESFKNSSGSEFHTEYIDHHRAYTTLNRKSREVKNSNKWTNSVPRIPKKIMPPIRSRSENRYQKNNPYKYVDTTTLNSNGVPLIFTNNTSSSYNSQRYNNFSTHTLPTVNNNLSSQTNSTNTISNRLFGLSQKLKEFSTNVVNTNHKFINSYNNAELVGTSSKLHRNNHGGSNNTLSTALASSTSSSSKHRRNSLGELYYKTNVANLNSRYGTNNNDLLLSQPSTNINNNNNNNNNHGANLKSVIKKSDDRKHQKNNNEKKVTFSAFATVQVV